MNEFSTENMKALTILLAEDNEDHAELIIESLRDFNVGNEVIHVADGQALIDYLAELRDAPDRLPDLILLDLKMPRLDGKGALRIIKEDEVYRTIPVLVVTTSGNQVEIEECYKFGANSYITKPLKFDDFHRKIRDLNLYWVITSELPSRE
ncbi:MAG: response regulator [Ketobacteraceae bacterium]|nr:response regulator [Ketobacteraceae bacterium]